MRKSRLASSPTRLEPWRAIVEELSANWKLAGNGIRGDESAIGRDRIGTSPSGLRGRVFKISRVIISICLRKRRRSHRKCFSA